MLREIVEGIDTMFLGRIGQETEEIEIKEIKIKDLPELENEDYDYFLDDIVEIFDFDIRPNDEKDYKKIVKALISGNHLIRWDVYGDGVIGVSPDKRKLEKGIVKEFGPSPKR